MPAWGPSPCRDLAPVGELAPLRDPVLAKKQALVGDLAPAAVGDPAIAGTTSPCKGTSSFVGTPFEDMPLEN